jgi:hypothetical protein
LTSELPFMVGKTQESHGARSGLYGRCSNGFPPILVRVPTTTSQLCNADAPLRLLCHPKKSTFKTTVTPFLRGGWSVIRTHCLPKEVLQKRDHHHTSKKF